MKNLKFEGRQPSVCVSKTESRDIYNVSETTWYVIRPADVCREILHRLYIAIESLVCRRLFVLVLCIIIIIILLAI